MDPRDPELVLLGTNQFIYRSTNGGRTWVRRGGGLPVGDFTSIVINPTNPEEVMVAEYSRGGIYRSTDRGYYWDRIDTELPSNRVWTLTFDPFDRDRDIRGQFLKRRLRAHNPARGDEQQPVDRSQESEVRISQLVMS